VSRWPSNRRPETSRLLKVGQDMLHVRIKLRLGACYRVRIPTIRRVRVGRSSRPPVHDERYGPPGKDVCIGWHKAAARGWVGVVEDPRRGFNGVRGGSGGLWSRSVDRGAARRPIFCRKVRQNTARIDRTAGNTAICRIFCGQY
jgi:hypothetical protein